MPTFSSNYLRSIVKKAHPGDANVASEVDAIDFLEFSELESSIKNDVKFLQESPLVLKETKITGWVYEVETGKVREPYFIAWVRVDHPFQVKQIV